MSFSDMEETTERDNVFRINTGITVDVHFDFICPWCLIGKRNLDAAISRLSSLRPGVSVKVRWHSHQLLPDLPAGGVPYQAFYVARLGSPGAVAARRAQVQEAARAAGVELAFDRIEVMPNTRVAHELLNWATAKGPAFKPATLIDRLFTAYFMEGEDVGDLATLERLALACGVDAEGLAEYLAASRSADHAPWSRSPQSADVMGVPHFVIDSTWSLSGAYSPGAIVDALLRSIDAQENR